MSEDVNNNPEQEEANNIVILNDENGNEIEFEFLDLIELDGEEYVVLLPTEEDDLDDDGEVVILQLEKTDSEDEESYVTVESEETLNRVFDIFKEKFKDEFDFTD